MNTHKLVRLFGMFLLLFTFCLIGATILAYKSKLVTDVDLLIQVLLFSSLIEVVIYYYDEEYKSKLNLNTITFAIIRIIIAILYANNLLSLNSFCIFWGIFDCIRALINIIKNIYLVAREREYLKIAEIIISIVEFIFGMLLIIGTVEHLQGHLLIFGLSLLANGLLFTVENIIKFKAN